MQRQYGGEVAVHLTDFIREATNNDDNHNDGKLMLIDIDDKHYYH